MAADGGGRPVEGSACAPDGMLVGKAALTCRWCSHALCTTCSSWCNSSVCPVYMHVCSKKREVRKGGRATLVLGVHILE